MSVETFECNRCGAKIGMTGPGSGSDDDLATEDYYDSEVEFHESGQCAPAVAVPLEVFSSPVDISDDGHFTTAPQPDPRAEYIAGLRKLADKLEAIPDLPLPTGEITWGVFGYILSDDEIKAQIAKIARVLDGPVRKEYDDDYLRIYGNLRGLQVRAWAERSRVCERVVTGTHEVTKTVATATEEVTVTEEIVEWVCHPILESAVSL